VALAALVAAPTASPHPGHGPVEIDIGGFAYSQTDVQLYERDSVVFVWKGPDTDHSATADNGFFDTGTGHGLNDTYGVSFTKAGTFSFHCKVHSFMTGTITVQPTPAGTTLAGVPAPTLSSLKVAPATFSRKTTVKFTLNSPASVRARLLRGARTLKEVDFNA